MSRRKLVKNSKLLLVKITLGIITKGTTKVNRIEDFVVNIDQALTSNLILPRTARALQLIILLIYLLLIEVLIEVVDIIETFNLTILPTIILIRIVIQYSILIVIQINTPNFRNLFRIEFIIRIVIREFVQVLREKVQKRLYSIIILLRFNRLF